MLFQLPAIKKKKNPEEEFRHWSIWRGGAGLGGFFYARAELRNYQFSVLINVCIKSQLRKPILTFNKSTFPLKLVCIGGPKGRHMVHSCGCEWKRKGFVQLFSHGSLALKFFFLYTSGETFCRYQLPPQGRLMNSTGWQTCSWITTSGSVSLWLEQCAWG